MINIESLKVRYGSNGPALSVDRLRIERGQCVAIIGPTGAGKSTLLRSIKGYVRPAQGKVEVMGVNPWMANRREKRQIRRHIGLVYQQFHLLPRLSVLQNVLCGRLGLTHRWRSLLGWFSSEDIRIAWSAICEVGLEEQVHQRGDTLSGGEQQRVAVARVVAQEASIILADEPVSSLDPVWATKVLQLIGTVQSHHDTTLVMSLHQPERAQRFAQRIIGLRQGRIVFDGPPAALTEATMEEIYCGDDNINLNPSPSFRATQAAIA